VCESEWNAEWFEVKQGVRQGCVMSPWLFNVFMGAACVNTSRIKVGEADVRMRYDVCMQMMQWCWLRAKKIELHWETGIEYKRNGSQN
jgi:hypothetical protein